MKIKTVPNGKLLVRIIKNPNKIGHIYIPDEYIKNTQTGVIKVIGEGIKSSLLQPEAIVIFDSLKGVMLDKKENLLLLKEEDIMSVVEKEPIE